MDKINEAVKETYDRLGLEMIVESGVVGRYCVLLHDYLKIVEEKERLEENIEKWEEISLKTKQNFTKEINKKDEEIERLKEENKYCVDCSGSRVNINKLEKKLKEKDEEILCLEAKLSNSKNKSKKKDEEIERLEDKISCLEFNDKRKLNIKNDALQEVKKQRDEALKEIERLKNLYEPEVQYQEWCELKYYYKTDKGKTKTYTQEMLLEDAYELIGMDSDNWLGFVVMKFRKEVK